MPPVPPLVFRLPKLRARPLKDESVFQVQVQAGMPLEQALEGRDPEPIERVLLSLYMFHRQERDEWLAVNPHKEPAEWVLDQLSRNDHPWPQLAYSAVAALAHSTWPEKREIVVTDQYLADYRAWIQLGSVDWESRFFSAQGPFRARPALLDDLAKRLEGYEASAGWMLYEPQVTGQPYEIVWRDLSRRLVVRPLQDDQVAVCHLFPRYSGQVAALLRPQAGEFETRVMSTAELASWIRSLLDQHPVDPEQVLWKSKRVRSIPLAYGPLMDVEDERPGVLKQRVRMSGPLSNPAWSLQWRMGAETDFSNPESMRNRVTQLGGNPEVGDDELRGELMRLAERQAQVFSELPQGSSGGWLLTEDPGQPDANGSTELLHARAMPSGFVHAGFPSNPNRLRGSMRHPRLEQPINPFAEG